MKILHADTDDLENPLRGGQPVRTFEINCRLVDHHDITVLTATFPGCTRRFERGDLHYRRLGVTVHGLGLSAHLSFLVSLGLAIRRLPHDLVVEEFMPPFGFGLLPWCTPKPVISIVQWFSFDNWERRYRLPFEKIMKRIGRTGRYENLIVQTSAMAGYFRTLLPSARIWTIGCGVDDAAFHPDWSGGEYVLYVGRLDTQQKGLDLLLEAWTRLRSLGHDIPLKVVGEGQDRAALERDISRRSLAGCIELLGRVEGADKRELIDKAAFTVMPSRQETFGIVALESMAASKPVIAFDIQNLNEVLQPGWAVLVGGFDSDRLAHEVADLWNDPARRRRLGQAGFTAAQNRRWDTLAQQQEAIYRQVAGASHGR